MNFQPEKESWLSYEERLEMFFLANKVFYDDKKITTLILENDPSFYTLLKELSFPVDPKQLTYNDVMVTLKRHYVGVKNIFNERKAFYRAKMGPNETASEWHRRLKSLAIDCEFGVFLEQILVDTFVCGFRGKIFQRFCEQDANINLLDALKIAQLHEKNFQTLGSLKNVEAQLMSIQEGRKKEPTESKEKQFSTLELQDVRRQENSEQFKLLQQQQLLLKQVNHQRHLLNQLCISQAQQQQRPQQNTFQNQTYNRNPRKNQTNNQQYQNQKQQHQNEQQSAKRPININQQKQPQNFQSFQQQPRNQEQPAQGSINNQQKQYQPRNQQKSINDQQTQQGQQKHQPAKQQQPYQQHQQSYQKQQQQQPYRQHEQQKPNQQNQQHQQWQQKPSVQTPINNQQNQHSQKFETLRAPRMVPTCNKCGAVGHYSNACSKDSCCVS